MSPRISRRDAAKYVFVWPRLVIEAVHDHPDIRRWVNRASIGKARGTRGVIRLELEFPISST